MSQGRCRGDWREEGQGDLERLGRLGVGCRSRDEIGQVRSGGIVLGSEIRGIRDSIAVEGGSFSECITKDQVFNLPSVFRSR